MWKEKQKLEMDLSMIDADKKRQQDGEEEEDDADLDVPRTSEVRGQNWCAVSIVSSPTVDDEPCINVLRAFETREEAEDYVRNTASRGSRHKGSRLYVRVASVRDTYQEVQREDVVQLLELEEPTPERRGKEDD